VALRTVESEAIARSVHCDKEVAADQGVDGAWEPMLESPPMTPNGLSATALAILHCCRATALLPGDGTAAGRRRKIREPASVDAEPFLQELAGIDGLSAKVARRAVPVGIGRRTCEAGGHHAPGRIGGPRGTAAPEAKAKNICSG
jgi:hypothetical protein